MDLEKISRANSIVTEHRLRRITLQFCKMASQAERFVQQNPGKPVADGDLSEMSDAVLYISRHVENDSRSEIRQLVESLQNVMAEAEVDDVPASDLFALLRVHGEALLGLQRGEEEASDLIVRAIFTATKVIDKRVKKRRQAAGEDGSDEI